MPSKADSLHHNGRGEQTRLCLRPVTVDMKAALAHSRAAFERLTGLVLPDGWPEFPEAFDPSFGVTPPPWGGYLFLANDRLVGNGGFVGQPADSGVVEIGFEVAPSHRNQGHGTRAISSLIALAFENGATRVTAHSLAIANASNAAMTKAGMKFCEACPHSDLGWTWRYEIADPETCPT